MKKLALYLTCLVGAALALGPLIAIAVAFRFEGSVQIAGRTFAWFVVAMVAFGFIQFQLSPSPRWGNLHYLGGAVGIGLVTSVLQFSPVAWWVWLLIGGGGAVGYIVTRHAVGTLIEGREATYSGPVTR